MKNVTVSHRTEFLYKTSVELGKHRLMVRPKDSHDMKVIQSSLEISPEASVSNGSDRFGNHVETVTFKGTASELILESRFVVAHSPRTVAEIESEIYRFSDPSLHHPMVLNALVRRAPDPNKVVASWARQVASTCSDDFETFIEMTGRIRQDFRYASRAEKGTQAPAQTLSIGSGTCRDFAFLMVEAARSLGHSARFVSGYLYDENRNGAELLGGQQTHAWVEVYLAGAGWVEFDPTNNLVGGRNLLRVASVLKPSQALPVVGGYFGWTNACTAMNVNVQTTVQDGQDLGMDCPLSMEAAVAEEMQFPGFRNS